MACIPIKTVRVIKKALQDGKLSVDDLLTKTTEEREEILLKYIDEKQAKNVSDFIIKKFKTELDEATVEEIFSVTNKVEKLRKGEKALTIAEWKNMKTPPEWAQEYVKLNNKIEDILNPRNQMGVRATVKDILKEGTEKITSKETLGGKALQTGKMAFDVLTSGVYKSIKASFDMSYALRQGFKVLTKSPGNWGKSFTEAWQVWKKLGSKTEMDAVMNEFKARYLAHPHYDLLVNDGKLAFGVVEDFFPTTLAAKLPAVGNVFKASDEAFTVFSQSARFGLASDLVEKQLALKGVEGLTKEEVKAIAMFSNSITGRGSLGNLESASGALNKLFFSARFVRSQLDTFMMPFNPSVTPFVRQEALKHSLTTLTSVGAIMATASMLGDVETDPRSSAFGKIKIGDKTRIDLTAGLGSYIVLATKLASGESVSATSGRVTKLNSDKYGAPTKGDVLAQWAANKLAPAPGAINRVLLQGKEFGGKKPTVGSVTTSLGVPISIENIVELMQEEEGATVVAAWVADVLGASSQVYSR